MTAFKRQDPLQTFLLFAGGFGEPYQEKGVPALHSEDTNVRTNAELVKQVKPALASSLASSTSYITYITAKLWRCLRCLPLIHLDCAFLCQIKDIIEQEFCAVLGYWFMSCPALHHFQGYFMMAYRECVDCFCWCEVFS